MTGSRGWDRGRRAGSSAGRSPRRASGAVAPDHARSRDRGHRRWNPVRSGSAPARRQRRASRPPRGCPPVVASGSFPGKRGSRRKRRGCRTPRRSSDRLTRADRRACAASWSCRDSSHGPHRGQALWSPRGRTSPAEPLRPSPISTIPSRWRAAPPPRCSRAGPGR